MMKQTNIVEKIKQDIIIGVLKGGEPLKIEPLKERYQIGGSPIREALNQLAAENFIKFIPAKGFQAYALSLAHVEDIYIARIAIEKAALIQAIDNACDESNALVVAAHYKLAALEKNKAFRADPSIAQYLARYREFHLSLFMSCPSDTLKRLLMQLYDQSERYRYYRFMHVDLLKNIDEKAKQHTVLVDLYLNGDTKGAVDLLVTLLSATVSRIKQSIA